MKYKSAKRHQRRRTHRQGLQKRPLGGERAQTALENSNPLADGAGDFFSSTSARLPPDWMVSFEPPVIKQFANLRRAIPPTEAFPDIHPGPTLAVTILVQQHA